MRLVRRTIREVAPDVIVSWGTWANLVTLPARMGLRVPVMLSERVDPRERGNAARQASRVLAYRAGRPEAMIVPTLALAEWARRVFGRERVHAIPNIASIPATNEAADVSASTVIVGAGRLAHQKGFDLLLRAFALCGPSRPPWRLRILGEGEDRPKLEALVRELGIGDRVELPGFANDLGGEFRKAAFLVLSSRFEGFGLVMTEAMAAGLPVVAFDSRTGPGEIVNHEVDGLLVPPEDVGGLAAAMARLMDDVGLRSAMAQRAPDVAERSGAARIFAQWDALLADVACPPRV